MAKYSLVAGSFMVSLDKASYAVGDVVKMAVAFDVSKSGFTAGAWSVNVSVYDAAGNLLDRDGETNFETTTHDVSTLSAPKIHPQFAMTTKSTYCRVVLDADGVVLGTITKYIQIVSTPTPEPEEEGKFTLAPGSFQVRATNAPYQPNETVELAIAYDISKKGFSGEMTWSVNVYVYAGGVLLDKDGETNALTTARSISSLANPTLHPRFKMGSADMPLTVKLEAVYSPTIYSTKTVPLGTIAYTVMVAEEPGPTDAFALIPGSFKVVPDKSAYKTGDTVKLYVGYDVTRTSNVGVSWSVNASVYNTSGKLLDRDGETNAFTTPRSISPAGAGAYIHPRFKMGNNAMQVKVVLDADGYQLAATTITIPLSSADGDESPPANGGGGADGEGTGEQGGTTLFGIPVVWIGVGGGLLVLLLALSGRRGGGAGG